MIYSGLWKDRVLKDKTSWGVGWCFVLNLASRATKSMAILATEYLHTKIQEAENSEGNIWANTKLNSIYGVARRWWCWVGSSRNRLYCEGKGGRIRIVETSSSPKSWRLSATHPDRGVMVRVRSDVQQNFPTVSMIGQGRPLHVTNALLREDRLMIEKRLYRILFYDIWEGYHFGKAMRCKEEVFEEISRVA